MINMKKITKLTDIIKKNSENSDQGIVFIEGNNKEKYLSYQELYSTSLLVLNTLQESGIKAGDELILQINENEDFLLIFWACLLGGIIPVPVSVGSNNEHKAKLFKIWKTLNNPHMITDNKTLNNLKNYAEKNPQPLFKEMLDKTILTNDNLISSNQGEVFDSNPENIAFIQFSSGSTGEPKGVVLTHENLITNIFQMIKGSESSNNDRFLSWMPLTHDMGIIGMHLVPSMVGALHYFIPTSVFIRRPTLWWTKVHEHKVTLTCSPNFGYSYFLMHFKPEIASDWDLSQMRLILNGAEPISPNLCNQFLELLSTYNLKNTVMLPVYGLAEASLGVTFPPLKEEVITKKLNRNSLNIGQKIVESHEDTKDTIEFVDVGFPLDGLEVSIWNDSGQILEDCTIGYIQIKGKNVTNGYYNNKKKTEEAIQNGWLNTGDIGFLNNGRLVITGRAKDIIFINGQNIYPHDIERVAEDLEDIKLGYIAACGVANHTTQSDQIILFVLYKKELTNFIPLMKKLKSHISKEMGIDVDKIIPVKKIPKTTSGKFERYKLSKAYLNGDFDDLIDEIEQLRNSMVPSQVSETQSFEIPVFSNSNDQLISEIQKNLLQLLKDTFEVEEIGIHENFFDLGGNSLLLTRLHERIEQLYPGSINVTDIFTYSSTYKLATYIGSKGDITLNNIDFAPIKIPSMFLNNEHTKGENSIFKYEFNNDISKVIIAICEDNAVDIHELFLTLFISLLAKISEEKEITVQAILGEEEVAHSLKVVIDKDIEFFDLLKSIKLKNENIQLLASYSIDRAMQTKLSDRGSGIIPLFSKRNILSTKYNLPKFYDLILYVHHETNEINLTLQYNGKTLRKDPMRNFFNSYIKLVNLFINKYIEKSKGVLN